MYKHVVEIPFGSPVFDFSTGKDLSEVITGDYGIGRFNEKRPGMYQGFQSDDNRDIHMGVDLFVPAGVIVRAFHNGEIIDVDNNDQVGDYGYTITAQHTLEDGRDIFALYGHLGAATLDITKPGDLVSSGQQIAIVGSFDENGNWPPHVHFQLSWVKPEFCDMPGVVNDHQLEEALKIYPDPRLVLGDIY